MDLEPLRKSFGHVLRVAYPGALFMLVVSSRKFKTLDDITIPASTGSQLVSYAVVMFVCGVIIYSLSRALFFELFLNRLRDRWWRTGSLAPNTESRALIARFPSGGLAEYLDLRFGWCYAQVQTCVLLPLGLIIGAPGSLWCDWRSLLCVSFVTAAVFFSTIIQLRTLWRMEKNIEESLR